MIIQLRVRVLWYNQSGNYYQEMYVTLEQYKELAKDKTHSDVTDDPGSEARFKLIKQQIKDKLNGN